MNTILGVDLGTQSVKVMLLSPSSGVVGVSACEYEVLVPQKYYAEQNPEEWWNAFLTALNELRQAHPVEFSDISCVGITGQMHGLVMMDANRNPLCNSIIWVDQRSKLQVDKISSIRSFEQQAESIHNRIFTGFALPSLLWIKENKPELYDQIEHICCPKDFLVAKLCRKVGSDYSDASSTTAFHIPKGEWDYELIEELGLKRSIFPEVHDAEHVFGVVTKSAAQTTGLRAGIPVISGCGDQAAFMIGNGGNTPGNIVLNIGTGATVCAVTNRDLYDPQMRVHTFYGINRNTFTVFGAILAGGLSLRWAKNQLFKCKNYKKMSKAAEQIEAGSSGLFYLPYINGERTPHMDPEATGAFLGMSLIHDQRHFIRAIMEGVAFGIKDSCEILAEMGIGMERVIASGGGASSPVWVQILSDVINREIRVTQVQEQACLGICILAGVSNGIFGSIEEACKTYVTWEDRIYTPSQNRVELYAKAYEKFRLLYPAIKEIMHR